MDIRQTADVSRFLLFEATGDSEADADPIMDQQSAGVDGGDDDDDAESCIYEGSENQNSNLGDQQPSVYESCVPVPDAEYEHRDWKKNDKEEADVYGTSYCDDDEIQKHRHKSSLSVESGQQLMDEMEKNRQFWEACLAS